MNRLLYSMIGIIIPFIGTSIGSGFVFFLRKNINKNFEKIIIGIAGGVMFAASIWSLIIPSIEIAKEQKLISWFPATIGLILGIMFLIVINKTTGKIEKKINRKKTNMLFLSVTLHNIPEGLAVGVCFAGFLSQSLGITLIESMLLSIGIAIQNIPEGAIISMPLKMNKMSKFKAFLYGILSGVVEPIAAVIALMILNIVVPILPYLLAFAAGAMFYVIIEELIPEMQNDGKSKIGIIGFTLGFIVMMVLDVAL